LVGIISKKIMKQGELMRRLLGDGEEGGYDAVRGVWIWWFCCCLSDVNGGNKGMLD
jgi:hypothetical protein